MRQLIGLICLMVLVAGCHGKSVRYPERGPEMTPIGVPQTDRVTPSQVSILRPRLITTPVEQNDASVMPIFQPERTMLWHIQGYTKSNSVYIGPHVAVLKIEPGRFLRNQEGTLGIPVAAPFVEVGEDQNSTSTPSQHGRRQETTSAKQREDRVVETHIPQPSEIVDDLPEPVRTQVESILQQTKGK